MTITSDEHRSPRTEAWQQCLELRINDPDEDKIHCEMCNEYKVDYTVVRQM